MSNEKDITEKTIADVYKEIAYKTDVGTKAHVERTAVNGKEAENINWELQKVGQRLKEQDNALKVAEYLGSAAVHYYRTPALRQIFFMSQPGAIGQVPEMIVQDGITAMRSDLTNAFRGKRQKKRSGF